MTARGRFQRSPGLLLLRCPAPLLEHPAKGGLKGSFDALNRWTCSLARGLFWAWGGCWSHSVTIGVVGIPSGSADGFDVGGVVMMVVVWALNPRGLGFRAFV